jgi:hypothetical protein
MGSPFGERYTEEAGGASGRDGFALNLAVDHCIADVNLAIAVIVKYAIPALVAMESYTGPPVSVWQALCTQRNSEVVGQ